MGLPYAAPTPVEGCHQCPASTLTKAHAVTLAAMQTIILALSYLVTIYLSNHSASNTWVGTSHHIGLILAHTRRSPPGPLSCLSDLFSGAQQLVSMKVSGH